MTLNLITDLSIHGLILFIVLTCFFLLYITKITKSAMKNHLSDIIDDNIDKVINNRKIMSDSIIENIPFEHVKKNFEKTDKFQKNNNDWLQYSLIITNILLALLVIIFINVLMYICNKNIDLIHIIKINLYTFILVGFVEYLFFKRIAMKWVPSKPSLMINTILDNIKRYYN